MILSVYQWQDHYYIWVNDLGQGYAARNIEVDGKKPETKGGSGWQSPEFYSWEGRKPREIERIVDQGKELKEYRLKESMKHLYGCVPMTRPADYFPDSEAEERNLYDAIYEPRPPKREGIEFEIIRLKERWEPLPREVTSQFPHFLNHTPEFWHLFPCIMNQKYVFTRVCDAIMAKLEKCHPGRYVVNDYRNIESFTLKEKQGHVEIRIINIVGSYKDDKAEKVHAIAGKNYDELQEKLQAYVDKFLEKIKTTKRTICSTCAGDGYIELEDLS